MDRVTAFLRSSRAPYWLLVALCLVSLTARAYRLDDPCPHHCANPARASLIFDEVYYVNAARAIAGVPQPATSPYAGTPAHHDPNSEHPQLGKLVMAGGIEVFGDGPWGWRSGSLLFGTLAMLLFFALVRSAGGSPWLALGATAVMSVDNLSFVHGRIATLDIYALAFVLGAATAYLRGKPVLAGVVLGVGMCAKLVSFYLLFALGVLELIRWVRRRQRHEPVASRDPLITLATCIVLAGVTYGVVLGVMDALVPPWDPGAHAAVTGGPLGHTRHMLDTAKALTQTGGPQGAASYPWSWVTGGGQFDYLRIVKNDVGANGTVVAQHPVVDFRGAVNPFLLLVGIPALFAAAAAWWRRGEDVDALVIAWFVGIFGAFCVQSVFSERIMYVHYVLLVLPAIWLATARLFSPARVGRAATSGWAAALLVGVVQTFPFRS